MSDRRKRDSMTIPFLMQSFEASVVVPRDITQHEAERLIAMIRTLPVGDHR